MTKDNEQERSCRNCEEFGKCPVVGIVCMDFLPKQSKEGGSYEEKLKGFTTHLASSELKKIYLSEGRRQGREEGEKNVRYLLWLNHGHSGVDLYGDDGEMQCKKCMPNWDYKRGNIIKVITIALEAKKQEGYTEAIEKVKEIVDKEKEQWLAEQKLRQITGSDLFEGIDIITKAIDKIKEPKGEGK